MGRLAAPLELSEVLLCDSVNFGVIQSTWSDHGLIWSVPLDSWTAGVLVGQARRAVANACAGGFAVY